MLKIVASQYEQRESKVRCALLDMSKVFDMVDHSHLFDLLLQRKLPHSVLHFLTQWYSYQRLHVRWKGTLSSSFTVVNGVRQGGILSPILFTVYIDKLLQWLSKLGVGCHWRGCLLVASVTLMTLLYLLLQHMHLEECCKSAQILQWREM